MNKEYDINKILSSANWVKPAATRKGRKKVDSATVRVGIHKCHGRDRVVLDFSPCGGCEWLERGKRISFAFVDDTLLVRLDDDGYTLSTSGRNTENIKVNTERQDIVAIARKYSGRRYKLYAQPTLFGDECLIALLNHTF